MWIWFKFLVWFCFVKIYFWLENKVRFDVLFDLTGLFDLIWFDLKWFNLIQFDSIWFDSIWSGLVWSDFILFDLIRLDLVWFDSIWLSLVRFDLVWFDLIIFFAFKKCKPWNSWCDFVKAFLNVWMNSNIVFYETEKCSLVKWNQKFRDFAPKAFLSWNLQNKSTRGFH